MRYIIRYIVLLIIAVIPITFLLSRAEAEEYTYATILESKQNVTGKIKLKEYPWWVELAAKEIEYKGVHLFQLKHIDNPIHHFKVKTSTRFGEKRNVKLSFQVASSKRTGVEVKWFMNRWLELKASQTIDQSWLEVATYRW